MRFERGLSEGHYGFAEPIERELLPASLLRWADRWRSIKVFVDSGPKPASISSGGFSSSSWSYSSSTSATLAFHDLLQLACLLVNTSGRRHLAVRPPCRGPGSWLIRDYRKLCQRHSKVGGSSNSSSKSSSESPGNSGEASTPLFRAVSVFGIAPR